MHICLFHKTNSRSQRILWLLEELHLDYEVIYDDHPIPTQELEKLPCYPSSLKFPTVKIFHDDSTESIVMSETAAIADYLSHQLNTLSISQLSHQEIQFYYYWKNFAEATFMPCAEPIFIRD